MAPAADAPASKSTSASPGEVPQAEALMHELSHDLMSPYCPGRTIASCPSPQARKLESHILEQAEAGKSREEIETALVARFPDIRGYVGRPEILYGTAIVALVAIVGLALAARRWVRRTTGGMTRPGAPMVADLGAAPAGPAGAASRRENDALDDALGRIDEF
jgi:cytochrome c-type biogenesis protein CcmH/NrfF